MDWYVWDATLIIDKPRRFATSNVYKMKTITPVGTA